MNIKCETLAFLMNNNITPNNVAKVFNDKFGVIVKNEGNLFLFKYAGITSNFSEKVTLECRGLILRYNGMWSIVSRPFDKFFNIGEKYCVLNNDTLNDIVNDLSILTKEDGTCIQVWYDENINDWRISTLGTISCNEPNNISISFEQLFKNTINWNALKKSLLNKQNTYIFELCAEENKIVTSYPTNRAYLLGARNILTGEHVDQHILHLILNNYKEYNGENLFLPYSINVQAHHNIQSIIELCNFAKQFSIENSDGQNPEGVVVYYKNAPIAKIKNESYIHLHKVIGGTNNLDHFKDSAINAYFENSLDDIIPYVTKSQLQYIECLKEKIDEIILKIKNYCNIFNGVSFDNQKQYALFVQNNIENIFHSFFFSNKSFVLNKSVNNDIILSWIKNHVNKFKSYLKNV